MFKIVDQFEEEIAKYFGSKYAVAVDCCTHAIELCLRNENIKQTTCPSRTYISIPFTLEKLGIVWNFRNEEWNDYYFLGGTNIIDAAVLWKKNSYIPGTLMCLSFQYRKHLNLGRGGAILVDDFEKYTSLKKMSYDGRMGDKPWAEQDIDTIGYHYYMTPETAILGLAKIDQAKNSIAKKWSYLDYPYLPDMRIFKCLA